MATPRREEAKPGASTPASASWTVPSGNTLTFSNVDSPYAMLVKKTGGGAVTLSGTNVIDGHVRLAGGDVRLLGQITTSAGVDATSVNVADTDRHTFFVDLASAGVATLAGVEVDKPFCFGVPNGKGNFVVEAGTTNVFNGPFASRNESNQRLILDAESELAFNGGFRQDWALTFEGSGTIYLRNKPYVRGSTMSDSVARDRNYYFLLNSPKGSNGRLTAVIEARNLAAGAAKALAGMPGDPSAMRTFAAAESGLAGVLSKLMLVVEKYPDLKADRQMARVSEELTSTENRIAFARQAYNDAVTEYNTQRELFPSSLVANAFGFASAALLAATDAEAQRTAPAVAF